MAASLGPDSYYQAASAPITGTPFTISGMLTTANNTAAQTVLRIASSANQSVINLAANGGVSPGRATQLAVLNSSGSSTVAYYDATYPLNQWVLRSGISASDTSRLAIFGTTKSAEVTANIAPSGLDILNIGRPAAGSEIAFVAEAAIWNVVLTDAEIASLDKGFKPYRVRPQSLVFYAPLVRVVQDVRNGITLTPTNSPTVADHPRVY